MGNSSQQTQTTQSGLPEQYAPWLNQYANQAFGTASLPYEQYQGQRVAGLPQMQLNALQGINSAMYGTPQTQASGNYLTSIYGAGGNPNIGAVRDRLSGDVAQQYQDLTGQTTARFSRAGTFGSSAHQQAQARADTSLARGLGDSLGQLDYNAYEAGQNRQMQGIPLALQSQNQQMNSYQQGLNAGNVPRQYQQDLLNSQYQDWQGAQNYPREQLNILQGAIGPLFGAAGQQQTTTMPGQDRASQIIGGGSLLASMLPRGGSTGSSK